MTTAADGTVTITAEYELPRDDEQDEPEPPPGDTMADIIGGAGRAVGRVLGGIWDAIKPDDSAAPPEED